MPAEPPRMIDGDPAAAGEAGLAVMTMVDGSVGVGRLVDGQYQWCERFDAEHARQLGLGLLDAALRARRGRKVTDGPTTGEVADVAAAIRNLCTGGLPEIDEPTIMRIAAAAIALGASPAFARGDHVEAPELRREYAELEHAARVSVSVVEPAHVELELLIRGVPYASRMTVLEPEHADLLADHLRITATAARRKGAVDAR